jgi:lysozyme
MSRRISPQGIAFIKRYEKCSLKAYQHKGDRPTIGWGNTFYEDGSPVKLGDAITQNRADLLFLNIIRNFEQEVDSLVTSEVNQNQFDALCSFAYNVGTDIDADTIAEGLGDSTLLKYVNANPNDKRIAGEFGKWISKGTQFEKGLTARRKDEAVIYFTPI